MRKAALFLTALAAIACSKTPTSPETPPTLEPEALKFDIRVADLGDTDNTKAPKKGWEKGDILNIWFDNWRGYSASDYYTSVTEMISQFHIQYDGSKWNIVGYPSETTIKQLKENYGYLTVIYEGNNKAHEYKAKYENFSMRNITFYPPFIEFEDNGKKVTADIRHMQAYTASGVSSYGFNKETNTLSGTIDGWKISTRLRILVKNDTGQLTGDAADWCLQMIDETEAASPKYPSAMAGFLMQVYNPSTAPISLYKYCLSISSSRTQREKGYTIGVKEGDDVAFYYDSLTATNATIKFRLINVKTGKTKSYTVTGQTLEDNGKCTGIALKHSKFK